MKPPCLLMPAILSILWVPVINCHAPDRDEADAQELSAQSVGPLIDVTDTAVQQPLAPSGFRAAGTASRNPLPGLALAALRIEANGIYRDDERLVVLERGHLTPDAGGAQPLLTHAIQSLALGVSETLADSTPPSALPVEETVPMILVSPDERTPMSTVLAVIDAITEEGYLSGLTGTGSDGQTYAIGVSLPPADPDLPSGRSWLEREGTGSQAGTESVAETESEAGTSPVEGTEVGALGDLGLSSAGPGPETVSGEDSPVGPPGPPDRLRRRFRNRREIFGGGEGRVGDELLVHLTAQPAGLTLLAGSSNRPVRGFRGADFPRDPRYPLIDATEIWSEHTELSSWVDWTLVQARLADLFEAGREQDLPLRVEVGVDGTMPYAVLVKLCDLVRFRVEQTGTISGAARTDAGSADVQAPELFMPSPSLIRVVDLPPIPREQAESTSQPASRRAAVFLDGSVAVSSVATGEPLPINEPFRSMVEGRIIRHRSAARRCYRVALDRAAGDIEGEMDVAFHLGERGFDGDVEVTGDIVNEELTRCVLEDLSSWSFPPPPGGEPVEVRYQFEFRLEP